MFHLIVLRFHQKWTDFTQSYTFIWRKYSSNCEERNVIILNIWIQYYLFDIYEIIICFEDEDMRPGTFYKDSNI